MRRVVDIGLIVGFLAVDLFFFHDVFKTGEVTTLPQYMTGFLSIVVFAICAQSLLKSSHYADRLPQHMSKHSAGRGGAAPPPLLTTS
jgi:hypothetical protein